MKGRHHEQIGEIRPRHDELPVGKIDKMKGPVDKREPDGKQGINTPGDQPIQKGLEKQAHFLVTILPSFTIQTP